MNTTKKIILKENKSLKLRNVLIREVEQNELMNINKVTYMMDSYIKSKGNNIIGPMINYSTASADENGQVKIILKFMVQLKNPMYKVETPYEIKDEIKVSNCLFSRFEEKEENLQFVYSKLQLYAFENDIQLKGDSYTVFVENKQDKIVADVFMEVQKEDLSGESI